MPKLNGRRGSAYKKSRLFNDGIMYEKTNPWRARNWYVFMKVGSVGEWFRRGQAVKCIQCRDCEGLCPKNILISEWMSVVHGVLGEGKPYQDFG